MEFKPIVNDWHLATVYLKSNQIHLLYDQTSLLLISLEKKTSREKKCMQK